MRNPLLTVRFVIFSILVYLNLLALGFAGWEISSINEAGLPMAGSPIFAMFNACAFFFFILLASAELVFSDAKTGQIYFECGWTGVMSALELASALDVLVNGPPVYCRTQCYEAICTSSTVLSIITWTASVLIIAYFLTLFYLSLSHSSVYGAFWTMTVYQAPWFVEPAIGIQPRTASPRASQPKEPWENPAFRAHEDVEDEQALNEVPLTPPVAPWSRNYDPERLSAASSRLRAAPAPARSMESLRPAWAKRVNTRRGVDLPFAPAPVANRVSRLVKSFWSDTSASPPPPPPKPSSLPSLPSPVVLGGFVDCHRGSYGHFPETVADEDSPIEQPQRSEWVQARR